MTKQPESEATVKSGFTKTEKGHLVRFVLARSDGSVPT